MSNSANGILSFLIGAVLASLLLWLILPESSDVEVQNEAADWSRWSDRLLEERLRDSSLDNVRAFVNWEMDQELPAKYVIPAHIANARSSGEAVVKVNREYAVFSSEKGDNFLRAVQADPVRYREYLRAHKAIRKRFKKE